MSGWARGSTHGTRDADKLRHRVERTGEAEARSVNSSPKHYVGWETPGIDLENDGSDDDAGRAHHGVA